MTIRRSGAVAVVLMVGATAAGAAQTEREIRLQVNPAREQYRFVPARIVAHPGDVLVFKVVSGAPHSVVFEAKGLSPQAHEALNAALPRRTADLSSPLLTTDGAEYRMILPSLPPGTYRFYCLPHRAYDMHGEVRIQ
ncbi:MAG TPA: plastocyanin/azurin family copper-binding protein [Gemmatimonadales bacterium]|jgi:plastocyanin